MRSTREWFGILRLRTQALSALAFGLLLIAAPASAQWTRVTQVPVTPLFSVWANGDTITAGADTAVYVSTNGGESFIRSAKPVAGVGAIEAVRVRN